MKPGTKLIAGALLLALLLIAGKLFLSEVSFSPANPSWDGISSAMGDNVRPLYRFDEMPPDGRQSTLLVVGPSANYSADDSARVLTFLGQGGRVVVMDDFGTANDLLHGISSPIAVRRAPLCQDVDYYKNPSFPVVRQVGASGLTANVSELVFNHPAPLQVAAGAEVLAQTTIMGWIDGNESHTVDGEERFGTYPLVARAAYGGGELFVAGDADLAINGMQGLGNDGALMRNVMRSGTVYVDVGHGQQVPLLAQLYYTIKYNIFAQIVFAILTFMTGYIYVIRGRIFRRREPEEARTDPRGALIAAMKAQLPLSDREIEEIDKKL